jgi:hypothetical protein
MSKKVNKLEPQLVLNKPFKLNEYRAFLEKVQQNNWIMAGYPNKDNPTAIYALLQGQTIENGEIVIDTKQLDLEKELQIGANDIKCSEEINKLLGVSTTEEAKIKQLNMLLAQASKAEGADEKLKDFEAKKNELLAYNKQLKAKINNSTSIKEIRKCVFKIEEIKEIKGIDTIK